MNAVIDATQPLWHMGALFHWLATAQETGGAYAIAEVEVRAGLEPPPHQHQREEESFYVFEGELDFVVDGNGTPARAGDFVVLPRGHVHGFRVRSDRARMLLMVTPAGLEEAFIATSEPATCNELPPVPAGPPPREVIENLIAVHGSHGIRFELDGR